MMSSQVTLDRAGHIGLPETLRDELHLSPGDTLDLTVRGDEVTLRPRRGATPLQKERGVWTFRTGEPFTADETEKIATQLSPDILAAVRARARPIAADPRRDEKAVFAAKGS